MKYFESMVGQEAAKKELSFYLDQHHENGAPIPHLLLSGQKGDGKTLLAKQIAKNLIDPTEPNRKHKRFYPINSANIENLRHLFEDVVAKAQAESEYSTFFFDEAHELPRKVQGALLSILETSKSDSTRYTYQDIEYNFDFRKLTFIFATTEDDKLFHAFKDRLTTINLSMYGRTELSQIIKLSLKDRCSFEEEAIEKISYYVRRNARFADRLASRIVSLGAPVFRENHVDILVDKLSLRPHGLEEIEVNLLNVLKNSGELSLSQAACRIGRPAEATRKAVEPYPLALGLMEIDGKRRISVKGRELLHELEKTNQKYEHTAPNNTVDNQP